MSLTDAAVLDPCDKCRLTTCFSLHAYTASRCPYKLCPECRELEILDAQIAEAHNLLINLSQKGHKLKERINRRHDQLTSRLPLEIISEIFNIVSKQRPYKKRYMDPITWNAVILIGAVCKRWRDITLGMPQLWSKVVIDPLKHALSPDITEQWISRSCALPLSLTVVKSETKHWPSESLYPNPSEIFLLLKSQASRWKDLTIYLSQQMFRDLLNRLEDNVPLDSLTISVCSELRPGIDNIAMKYPLVPKALHIDSIPVPSLPVQWYRLTRLIAKDIEVDELLYIFRSAHNLRDCTLSIAPGPRDTGHYPIPASPSINDSVTSLNTTTTQDSSRNRYLIRHLTLPSLETLFYDVTQTSNRKQLDALIDFIDRSQPPLRTFDLSFNDNSPPGPANVDWYGSLSAITTLELYIAPTGDEVEENSKLPAYIQGLNTNLVPMALPHLQYLKINASGAMDVETWDALAEIFPDSQSDVDVSADNALPMVSRPLKAVTIRLSYFCWEDREIMRRSTFRRLCRIRESGVYLKVYDEDEWELLGGLDVDCLTFIEDVDDEDDGNEAARSSEDSESVEHWE